MDPILKLLEKNARISPGEIAVQLGSTEADVIKAIKTYEENGTIVRYKAVLNDTRTGSKAAVRALIEVKVKPQKGKGFDGIAETIYKFPEVISCMLISGTYDLLLEVIGDDLQTVSNFVSQKLSLLEDVHGTVTHFILKKYKEAGDIFHKVGDDDRLAIAP